MKGGSPTDRYRSEDRHADEAGRFLDRDVTAEDLMPLIRGMDRIARIRAWKAVERKLGRGVGGGPRSEILEALEERETMLEVIGERPDRLTHGPRQSYDQVGEPPKTAAEVRAAEDTLVTVDDDQLVADAFATDGGGPE